MSIKINNKEIELDAEGYLIYPGDWTKDVAAGLATLENIELNDDYWQIFSFIRNHYREYGVIPDVRHTTKQMASDFNMDKKEAKTKLFKMFPYGYVQQACKVSGMRRPRGWSTG